MKKLLILSGKGGTGKTTVASAMIAFSKATAFADCDVDAPNLHLVTKQTGIPEKKDFFGGKKARIDQSICIGCGECIKHCRFEAITQTDKHATVHEISCEGCGVCQLVCPTKAITLSDDIAGALTLFREPAVFSTAELKMGRGNSGKLVTDVKFSLYGAAKDAPLAIIDGSPGIGCPVIASVSGVDLVLVVAEPSVSGISDLKRLLKTANVLNVRFAVCVNKYDVNEKKSDEIESFCKEKQIPFMGKIPFDKAMPRIINENLSILEAKGAAKDAIFEIYQKTMLLLQEPKS